MGLKSGSQGSGLDDDEENTDEATDQQLSDPTGRDRGAAAPIEADASNDTPTSNDSGNSDLPDASAIPYKQRREKVNAGREQVPYFLREHVIDAEDELQDSLEAMLGETVYKSDYREAAMVVAQRNPELVAEVLREWGYDL